MLTEPHVLKVQTGYLCDNVTFPMKILEHLKTLDSDFIMINCLPIHLLFWWWHDSFQCQATNSSYGLLILNGFQKITGVYWKINWYVFITELPMKCSIFEIGNLGWRVDAKFNHFEKLLSKSEVKYIILSYYLLPYVRNINNAFNHRHFLKAILST